MSVGCVQQSQGHLHARQWPNNLNAAFRDHKVCTAAGFALLWGSPPHKRALAQQEVYEKSLLPSELKWVETIAHKSVLVFIPLRSHCAVSHHHWGICLYGANGTAVCH